MRTRSLAVVGLVAALTLSACSDDDPEPRFEPSSSSAGATETPSSPTTETSETSETKPAEPTLPPEAQEATKEGAEAFARFYWAVVNYAQETGEVDLLRTLDRESCGGCRGGVQSIDRVYSQGGRMFGGEHTVLSARAEVSPTGGMTVEVKLKVERQEIRGAGSLNGVFLAGRSAVLMGVLHASGSWTVNSMAVS